MSENTPERDRHGLARLALGAAATVALLLASFAPLEWYPLAWVAFVPLLLALRVRGGWRGLLVLSLAGMAFGTLGFIWIRHVTWLGPPLLGLYLAVYFLAFCYAVRWLAYAKGVPLALAAPLTWTALEVLRSVLMSGLPWLLLAHTQYRALTVIQIADLAGAPGVTFWLVAVSGVLADALRFTAGPPLRRRFIGIAIAAVLSAAALWYGTHRLDTLAVRSGPRIAVLQGNIPQELKNSGTTTSIVKMFLTYRDLTYQAQASPHAPALIIWPETMAAPGSLDPQWDLPDNDWLNEIEKLQRRTDLVISAIARPDPDDDTRALNSVFFLPRSKRGPSARYDKIHLVPFGEYVPLRPLIGWIVGPFIPYRRGLTPGRRKRLFEIQGWRFAPTVCFEDAFPRLVAGFARELGRVDFIVNVTNEGWFKDGTELDEHLAIGVFRAVENRVGFVRAANTGISAFISPTGRIVEKLTVGGRDREVAGVLHGVALTADGRSPYLFVGELFGILCTAGWLLSMTAAAAPGIRQWLRRRREGRGAPS